MDGCLCEESQRLGRIRGDQYGVAVPLQEPLGQFAKALLVLNHEHRLCPGMRPSQRRRRLHDRLRGVRPWKIHLERGALADFTVDADAPAASHDDAVDGRHAEPRAFARFLGREERLEQASLHLAASCRFRYR